MALIGSVWVQTSWTSAGGFAPATWEDAAYPVAGTGPRTGDQRLEVMQAFEQGRVSAVADAYQQQRNPDVHAALDNADADDEQTALILYWLSGGF